MNTEAINSIKHSKFRRIKNLFIIIATLYILVCIAAFFLQDKLIFMRQKPSGELPALSALANSIEDIELTMSDGIKIRGWFLKNSASEKSNLLIYFGGNAEEVSRVIPKMSKLQNWSIALINYRGYGTSEGNPGEKALFSDSLEIYDYFSNKENINKDNIVVMGRSVGTGIATFLSQKRHASSVILVSPYDTLTNVAKGKLPFLPVNLILKHKFDSISRVPDIKSPLLMLVAAEDTLIPPYLSKRVAEAWGGKVYFEELAGEDHNSIDDVEIYWDKIKEFLSKQSTTSVYLSVPAPTSTPDSPALPSDAVVLKDKVVSTSKTDYDNDGAVETIQIVLKNGYFTEDKKLWSGSGPKWVGLFTIDVLKDKNVVSSQSLNKLVGSKDTIFLYSPEFELAFGDYNFDSQPDFTITQYFSSNGSEIYLFTISKDGQIEKINIENKYAFFQSPHFFDNSIPLDFNKNQIKFWYYDNTQGAYFTDYYTWDAQRKLFTLLKQDKAD